MLPQAVCGGRVISLQERTQRGHDWKQAVTNDFLKGDSVATIANRCACHKLRVEQVLREAISGLAALKAKEQV